MDEAPADLKYAGFWIRVGAALIDTVLIMALVLPLLIAFYGTEYLESRELITGTWELLINSIGWMNRISWINWVLAAVVVIFWMYRSATPGKMILKLKIIDAKTGRKISNGQCIGRYFAYLVSTIPFLLGFIWVGFDDRKQGWHDKLAGTLVVREP